MIGVKNLHTTAGRPNFPLGALYVRAGSAANVALLDVPARAGVSVTAVWMRVTNCDGESDDFAAVQTGTLWVVDVPAAHFATPGEVPEGVEVWASGTGADGDPHTWSIGVGDLCVLDGDSGASVPGVAWTAIKLRETAPTNPAYGDAMISSGAFYVWDGTQWVGGGGGGGIVDDNVTRTSSNAVKSSGIWSAIWGALTALPTGFTALYDWVVDQLDGKLSTSGGTMTGDITMNRGNAVVFGHTNGPAVYTNDGVTLRADTRGLIGAVALLSDIPTVPTVPTASTDTPLADGTASAGRAVTYARGDHVHPTDTTRQAKITASGILQGDGNGGVSAATIDATPTASSANPVQSGGVYTALANLSGDIVDDNVTRTSSNAVKSSGIWSAIWGALTALPTGFTALYDWVVDQLDGKLSTSGGTMTGDITMNRGNAVVFGHTNGPAVYTNDGVTLRADTRGLIGAVALLSDIPTVPTVPTASTDTPLADGTASAGRAVTYARGDHVHPTDTTRQAKITASGILQGDGNGGVSAATIDATPTASSANPVQSGGVYTALANLSGDIEEVADSLPYDIVEADYNSVTGIYGLQDRAVQFITVASASAAVTLAVALPAPSGEGKARDFFLDIDNSANATYAATLEFEGLNTDFVLACDENDDVATLTEIAAGERVRLYFTGTALTSGTGSSAKPVIQIARITLGAYYTGATT